MKIISGVFLMIFLFSCQIKSEENSKPMNLAKRPIEEITSEVYEGNVASYQQLRIVYLDMPPDEFLFWAMIMANKYDYGPAYLDVYYSMKYAYERGGKDFDKKDKMTKEFLLKYLNIAVKRKVEGAREEWNAIHR